MKKFFLKATIISFVLSVAIAFFSCSGTLDGYGPIFYNITKEVELEDAVVTGNVYSLVDAGAFLYTCNGRIYRKSSSAERGWSEVDLASDMGTGNSVIRLASTDGYLYAMTNSYKIYCTTINSSTGALGEWQDISDACATISTYNTTVEIFDNDAEYGTGKRRAFYSGSDGALYEFSGSTPGTSAISYGDSFSVKAAANLKGDSTYIPIKAAYISDSDITVVSNDVLLASNRTTYFYHMEEDSVYYSTDGISWTQVSLDSSTPYSFCYYTDGVGEWLYVGKKAGIEAIILSSGIPTTSISSSYVVGTNTTSCLGDSTTRVIGLYPYPYASGNIYAAAITYYSSTAASNTNKLWGYYPTRSNGENCTWNCE